MNVTSHATLASPAYATNLSVSGSSLTSIGSESFFAKSLYKTYIVTAPMIGFRRNRVA